MVDIIKYIIYYIKSSRLTNTTESVTKTKSKCRCWTGTFYRLKLNERDTLRCPYFMGFINIFTIMDIKRISFHYFFFPLSLLLSSSSPSNILALFFPIGVLVYLVQSCQLTSLYSIFTIAGKLPPPLYRPARTLPGQEWTHCS